MNSLVVADETKVHVKTKKEQPRMSGQLWTDDEEQRLIDLYESGCTYKKITKEMERSRLAVKARLSKLGLIQFDIKKALEKSRRRRRAG